MINVHVNNIWGRFDTKPKQETLAHLIGNLKYRPEGYQHAWSFVHKRWDGWNSVFDMTTLAFRIGLLPRVLKLLVQSGEEYRVVQDSIPEAHTIKKRSLDVKRFPHQDELRKLISQSQVQRGIYSSPTGSGKTVMMADAAAVHGERAVVFVADRVLLDQTKENFERYYGQPVGMIGDGEFEIEDITVCTLQSAASILGLRAKPEEGKKGRSKKESKPPKMDPRREQFLSWLRGVGTVVHDEVHYADNDTVLAVYEFLVAAHHVYGFSATPYKWLKRTKAVENLLLEQHFGKLEFSTDDKYDFVKMGLTVPLSVMAMPTPVMADGFRTYNEALSTQVVNNPKRTEMLAKFASGLMSGGHSCFVYFRQLKHAEVLQEAFDAVGCPLQVISGSTTRKARHAVFDALGRKEILGVLSDIGTVGLDIRSLDAIVMGSPVMDVRQLKGRVCRAAPGKESGIIFDPVDMTNILKGHWTKRLAQYKADDNTVVGCN